MSHIISYIFPIAVVRLRIIIYTIYDDINNNRKHTYFCLSARQYFSKNTGEPSLVDLTRIQYITCCVLTIILTDKSLLV